jgi:hypothetical protein
MLTELAVVQDRVVSSRGRQTPRGVKRKLKKAPPGCRLGDNANAFIGGFRMWEPANARTSHTPERSPHDRAKEAKGARP